MVENNNFSAIDFGCYSLGLFYIIFFSNQYKVIWLRFSCSFAWAVQNHVLKTHTDTHRKETNKQTQKTTSWNSSCLDFYMETVCPCSREKHSSLSICDEQDRGFSTILVQYYQYAHKAKPRSLVITFTNRSGTGNTNCCKPDTWGWDKINSKSSLFSLHFNKSSDTKYEALNYSAMQRINDVGGLNTVLWIEIQAYRSW